MPDGRVRIAFGRLVEFGWLLCSKGYKGRLLLDVVLRVPFSHSAGEGRLPAEQAQQIRSFFGQPRLELEDSLRALPVVILSAPVYRLAGATARD